MAGGRQAVLIAGTTASGKSARALEVARRTVGVIINTDSMQVYAGLGVLTAQPTAVEQAEVPHRLYGEIDPAIRYSTGAWLRAVRGLIASPDLKGRPLIFVGGTGLYFEGLLNGVAEVPEVSDEVLEAAKREVSPLTPAQRMALLQTHDPDTAARLKVADPQRTIRALAVLKETGKPLSHWQSVPSTAPLDGFTVEKQVIVVDKHMLEQRIILRLRRMLNEGAVDEVRALLARKLDPALPAMKAIGVKEIAAWLAGECDRETALERATIATRQYAKRQRTWLRQRMADWPRMTA